MSEPKIDVYAVGALSDLQRAWRAIAHVIGFYQPRLPCPHGWARKTLRSAAASFRLSWRRKTYWNGYLAEPTPIPHGLRTIGHGWTKRRALRRLERSVARIETEEWHVDYV